MAVTPSFRLFVEDQLGEIVPVRSRAMSYHSVPADLLEDTDRLRPWVLTATDVARGRRGEWRAGSE